MTGRHEMWDATSEIVIRVPVSGGENVMVPVIRAVVRAVSDPVSIILQRRVGPVDSVHGLLELPGGRWRSGESPVAALTREVREETGLTVERVCGVEIDRLDAHRGVASIKPLSVIAGVDGEYPAIHVVLLADASGEPRDAEGESADVRWWAFKDVLSEMDSNRAGFVPSTFAALTVYQELEESAGSL